MAEAAISSIEELVSSGKFAWKFSAAQASAWDLSPGDNPADLVSWSDRAATDRGGRQQVRWMFSTLPVCSRQVNLLVRYL